MNNPSVDTLVKLVGSRYRLAIAASLRAKQLDLEEPCLVEIPHSQKNVGRALEEIEAGLIGVADKDHPFEKE